MNTKTSSVSNKNEDGTPGYQRFETRRLKSVKKVIFFTFIKTDTIV